MDSSLSEQQQEALDEQLKRATAFEELIRTRGWEYIKAYFQTEVQAFANGLLVSDKSIADFESRRREIIGLRKLMGLVDSDLRMLTEFRQKKDGQPKDTTGAE